MAQKLNQKPMVPPDRIPADLVVETIDSIREKKNQLAKAQMGHAAEFKTAEGRGFRKDALKETIRMAKMSPAERVAYWQHLTHYVTVTGLSVDPQRNMFEGNEQMPSASEVAAAVGEIINVPPVPHPADMEGKKRLIGAWNKGVEARLEGRMRSDCLLTGTESIKTFEAGWDAMDAAIKAAAEGTTPAQGDAGAVGGYDIPEGMSRETFTALFQDGAALFRTGKSPGDHADAEDPAKARVLQIGWAAEQDEQRKAKEAQAAEEPVLTPEEMQAIKAQGAAACRDGDLRSKCPHPDGSVKADLWLGGFDEQDDALFSGTDDLGASAGNGEGAEDAGTDDGDAAGLDDIPELPAGDDDFPVAAIGKPTAVEVFAGVE